MANPTIGRAPCPICGHARPVSRETGRRKLLYLRCVDAGGSPYCGNIQPRGPQGQAYLEQHMTPLTANETEAEAEEQAAEAAQRAEQAARGQRKRSGSGLSRIAQSLMADEDDDD